MLVSAFPAASRPTFETVQKASGDVALARVLLRMENEARRAFYEALKAVGSRIDVRALARLIERKQVHGLALILPDITTDLQQALHVVENALNAAGRAEAKRVGARLGVSVRFDLVNPRAVQEAQAHAAALIRHVGVSAKLNVRALVEQALQQGIAPRVAAKQIAPLVGLLPQHALAVGKLRARLIDQGVHLTRVDTLVARYRARLLKYRGEMIARQEIMRAQNEGQRLLWQSAEADGLLPVQTTRKWVVALGACPICQQMAGRSAPINGFWTAPDGRLLQVPQDIHPQCRCTHVLAIPRLARRGAAARPRARAIAPASGLPPLPPSVLRAPIAPQVPASTQRSVPTPRKTVADLSARTQALLTELDNEIDDLLSDMVHTERMKKRGINVAEKATLANGRVGVFKPEAGERYRGVRRTLVNPSFTLAQRERLAYVVDRALGTDLVPRVVYRTDASARAGSMMEFVTGGTPEMEWVGRRLTDVERFRLSVLDVLIGNTDRHPGNWMRLTDGAPVAIDHGYSFPAGSRRLGDALGLRELRLFYLRGSRYGSSITRPVVDDVLNERFIERLEQTDWAALLDRHAPTMTKSERDAFLARVDWLTRHLSGGTFADQFLDEVGAGFIQIKGVRPRR